MYPMPLLNDQIENIFFFFFFAVDGCEVTQEEEAEEQNCSMQSF